jgi:hypothetical protein
VAEIWEWWALKAEGSSAAAVQIEQRGRYTYIEEYSVHIRTGPNIQASALCGSIGNEG